MSKIKINELKVNSTKSQFQELSDLETANIIGGCDQEEQSSRKIIQKAMQEAVMRSDACLNGSRN